MYLTLCPLETIFRMFILDDLSYLLSVKYVKKKSTPPPQEVIVRGRRVNTYGMLTACLWQSWPLVNGEIYTP